MKKEYELIGNKKYAVLWRKKGNKLTDKCPYCGAKHKHGIGEGHRIEHCVDSKGKNGKIYFVHGFFATDGTYLAPKTGYILREY